MNSPCARGCAKGFTPIIPTNPQNIPVGTTFPIGGMEQPMQRARDVPQAARPFSGI